MWVTLHHDFAANFGGDYVPLILRFPKDNPACASSTLDPQPFCPVQRMYRSADRRTASFASSRTSLPNHPP
jgi:hypothetical protein